MIPETLGGVDSLFVAHVVAFAVAAVACFASVTRVPAIDDPPTRRGLAALLLASGGWATAHVGFLVAPTARLQVICYVVGLIVGIAAVGTWLYFCSAYTGRSFHRNAAIRRFAVAVFLAIVVLKLTNPLHGWYFSVVPVTEPFPHLAVRHGLVHWLVMGLSYALAAIGYFVLFELFAQVNYDTKPLIALITLTGLPVLLDVVALSSPALVGMTYEPIGVAVFAVGVLFVYLDAFQAVRIAGDRAKPIVFLTDQGEVRQFNDAARELFPRLEPDATGDSLETVLPELAAAVESDDAVVEFERDGERRFYRITTNPFEAGRARLGRMVSLTDVTDRERARRETERQNERLQRFASVVSHDLRNPLNVAEGRLELAMDERDDEHLRTAADALDRMEALIEDVLALARQGQTIDETERVVLSTAAERSWEMVGTDEAELIVDGHVSFVADPDRLQQLLENLFRNAIEHGGEDATVRVGGVEDGFYVEDDGPGIPASKRESVFDSGYTTNDDGTGFGLAIVAEIVDAHGWSITVENGRDGGARFVITGVGR